MGYQEEKEFDDILVVSIQFRFSFSCVVRLRSGRLTMNPAAFLRHCVSDGFRAVDLFLSINCGQ